MPRKYKAGKAEPKKPQLLFPISMKKEFKARVQQAACRQYKTAAGYIREAIIEKMKRDGDWKEKD